MVSRAAAKLCKVLMEDYFMKSEAFNAVPCYAAKLISVKDVIGNVSSNGWADPMVAE